MADETKSSTPASTPGSTPAAAPTPIPTSARSDRSDRSETRTGTDETKTSARTDESRVPAPTPTSTSTRTDTPDRTGTPAPTSTQSTDGRDPAQTSSRPKSSTPPSTSSSTPSSSSSPLLPKDETDKLAERLQHALSGFVDDPRTAVEEADHVVEEITGRYTDALTQRRRTLRRSWQEGDATSDDHSDTEQLRLALRDYREIAERLLHA
ncbi:hypothetical protein ACIQI8_13045 [Streptomyces sp. NPDC092369]|uniref:hypothetical protein n=1 Tax=Streptomyces sp. NPDC092369 TaxID=3366015 RepID=UPI0037F39333